MHLAEIMSALFAAVPLARAVSYLLGAGLIALAFRKVFALGRRQSAGGLPFREGPAGIASDFIAGAALWYLPVTMDVLSETIFAAPASGLQYLNESGPSNVSAMVVLYIKVVGLIAMIRGLMLIAKLGEPAGQNGSNGAKAVSFLGSGILAWNIEMSAQIFDTLTGIDFLAFSH